MTMLTKCCKTKKRETEKINIAQHFCEEFSLIGDQSKIVRIDRISLSCGSRNLLPFVSFHFD